MRARKLRNDSYRMTPERLLHPGSIDHRQRTLQEEANSDEVAIASVAPAEADLS